MIPPVEDLLPPSTGASSLTVRMQHYATFLFILNDRLQSSADFLGRGPLSLAEWDLYTIYCGIAISLVISVGASTPHWPEIQPMSFGRRKKGPGQNCICYVGS